MRIGRWAPSGMAARRDQPESCEETVSGLGVARTPIEPCAGASSSTAAPATPVARNFNSLAAVENGV